MYSYCDTCWVILDSESHASQHFNSKVHQNTVNFFQDQSYNELSCLLCGINTTSLTTKKLHDESIKHLDRQKRKYIISDYISKSNKNQVEHYLKRSRTDSEINSNYLGISK